MSHFLQYGTKALDKITKAILGHIENKVPPPKGYPGGEAMFFRGMFELQWTAQKDQQAEQPLNSWAFLFFTDMKLGMMDVGIFCKEPRFGISTEKGTMFKRDACFIPEYLEFCFTVELFSTTSDSVICSLFFYVFITDCSITKFLNRILGLEVHKQNCLFQYFTDNFDYLIEKDKKEGKYDMGILGMDKRMLCVPEYKHDVR